MGKTPKWKLDGHPEEGTVTEVAKTVRMTSALAKRIDSWRRGRRNKRAASFSRASESLLILATGLVTHRRQLGNALTSIKDLREANGLAALTNLDVTELDEAIQLLERTLAAVEAA